ncbi:MAG TPA: ferritin family protein [Candidatus Eisenbacteria bacterium]|jgi:rubrerythrin
MAPSEPAQEGLTSLEALGVAMRQEADAAEVYRELAARLEEPVLRRRFELLAAEEEQHRSLLESKWAELAPDIPLKVPPSRLPGEMCTSERRSAHTIREVLDFAIVQERRGREFYLEAARETADLSGQGMFRYLADIKYAHWMSLAQERDLMIRYPNYGRRGPTPWRSEPRSRP